MDFPGIDEPAPDNITEQLKALDETISTTEAMLADSDKSITEAIAKRHKLAGEIQHLWNRRHLLNQELEKVRQEARQQRFYPR